MRLIRTLQNAILAMALVITLCWIGVSGMAHLIFNTLLGFNRTETFGEQVAADPLLPAIAAISLCLYLSLEFFRARIERRERTAR